MIKLVKGVAPQVLIDNAGSWTNDVMSYYNKGLDIPYASLKKYGHPDIKTAVINETNEKCAYCESCVTAVYYGDIEHIIPKAKYPRWAFYWKNLTFICNKCNNAKRDYASKQTPLLNPYTDDIYSHLSAFGPMIMHINASHRGKITHMRLKLNRKKLVEKRSEAILSFSNVLDEYNKETDLDVKEVYRDQLDEMLSAENEYAFTLICYAKAKGFIN